LRMGLGVTAAVTLGEKMGGLMLSGLLLLGVRAGGDCTTCESVEWAVRRDEWGMKRLVGGGGMSTCISGLRWWFAGGGGWLYGILDAGDVSRFCGTDTACGHGGAGGSFGGCEESAASSVTDGLDVGAGIGAIVGGFRSMTGGSGLIGCSGSASIISVS